MAEYELISSRANPKIKAAAALLDARERKKTGLFLAEGARLCADAAVSGAAVVILFVTPDAAEAYASQFALVSARAENVYYISPEAAEKLSDTASSQNFFCVCRRPELGFQPQPNGRYVLADRLQNPENLGALSRTAEAFGVNGLVLCSGCDPYAPKALRASMGALLRLPVVRAESALAALKDFHAVGVSSFAAVVHGASADVRTVNVHGGRLLVIGNEGSGLSEEVAAACTDRVTIPMPGKAESLNAAAACAILLWELMMKNG